MDLYSSLCTITKEENILRDEPMCRHTTFRVGGPADYFVTPQSVEEIRGDTRSMPERECSLLYCRKWKQSSCW